VCRFLAAPSTTTTYDCVRAHTHACTVVCLTAHIRAQHTRTHQGRDRRAGARACTQNTQNSISHAQRRAVAARAGRAPKSTGLPSVRPPCSRARTHVHTFTCNYTHYMHRSQRILHIFPVIAKGALTYYLCTKDVASSQMLTCRAQTWHFSLCLTPARLSVTRIFHAIKTEYTKQDSGSSKNYHLMANPFSVYK
jgi:hypothetical protein